MRNVKYLSLAAAAFVAAFAPAAASAQSQTQQGLAAVKRWQQADNCAKQAQTAFPDFTAGSNAKRDARLQQCLDGQNLPPRSGLSARP